MLLEIGREGESGKPFDWPADRPLVIGRGRDADLMIADPLLSRKHCQLDLRGDVVFVADLGSANGTFLNGIQATRSTVQPGDVVTFGRCWLRIIPEVSKVAIGHGSTGDDTKKVDRRSQPTDPERRAGDGFPVIEGYNVLGVIGKGSFGTVYRARHRESGRDAAIKVIPTGLQQRAETLARFLREMEATGQLRHPNLVDVYGAGEGEGFAYLIMEFVEGETLAERLKRQGKIEPARALQLARQVALALEHAFSRGYVHRDVKPENIIVAAKGVAKLCDFGLVKDLGASQNLTRPGQGFGSLAYMPPEQVKDAMSANQRADVYSLGATLYNMLAGKRPFSGQITKTFVKRVIEDNPDPLGTLEPQLPRAVCALVEKCMRKDPAERYPGPREVRVAIEAVLQGLETGLAPAYPPPASPKDPIAEGVAGSPASERPRPLSDPMTEDSPVRGSAPPRDERPVSGRAPPPGPEELTPIPPAHADEKTQRRKKKHPSDSDALADFAKHLAPLPLAPAPEVAEDSVPTPVPAPPGADDRPRTAKLPPLEPPRESLFSSKTDPARKAGEVPAAPKGPPPSDKGIIRKLTRKIFRPGRS